MQSNPAPARRLSRKGSTIFSMATEKLKRDLISGAISSARCRGGRLCVLTWPVLTVFGFIAQPRVHLYLKPTVTRRAAHEYGYAFQYRSKPSWETYRSLLGLRSNYTSAKCTICVRAIWSISSLSSGCKVRTNILLSGSYEIPSHVRAPLLDRGPDRTGAVVGVFAKQTHGFAKDQQRSIRLIQGLGIEGDAHAGSHVKHLWSRKRQPTQPIFGKSI